MTNSLKILGIESSCDDTGVAVVTSDRKIISNIIISQNNEHKIYQGVVPEIAARSHAEKILTILAELAVDWSTIAFISVTTHPGLPGALVVGVATAYTL